jgi:hypothetical protein
MKVKLWTIQDEQGWYELQSKGILIAKEEFVYPDFKDGYDWMKNQMSKRIGIPNDMNQYPIWAWYQFQDESKKRPELSQIEYFPTGTTKFSIEIEKEKKDILLSDFELWHTPLSYKTFIAHSEKEQLKFESELKRRYDTTSFLKLPIKVKRKIEKSWGKVFDMDFDVEYFAKPCKEKQIQATFWELSIKEVIRVDEFKAR